MFVLYFFVYGITILVYANDKNTKKINTKRGKRIKFAFPYDIFSFEKIMLVFLLIMKDIRLLILQEHRCG